LNYFDLFQNEIDKGIKNESIYIPLSQSKLNSNIIFGKSMYFLIGGLPGSGKTAIVDSQFLLEPYLYWWRNKDKLNINPYWIYRSMERNRVYKIAKWTAYLMYVDHNILIDVPTIMGWPNKLRNLSEEEISIIKSYKPFFDELFERVLIYDGSQNPTGIYKDAERFMLTKGEIVQLDQYNKVFKPNNSNLFVCHITDHVGKISSENNARSDKEILDLHSDYMGKLRDFYGVTCIDICQLNRNIENTYRAVNTDIDVQPQDFKGSSDMYENCDVAIGLLNPYKIQAYDYGGYKIKNFVNKKNNNRFRSLKIIKNSYGNDDFVIGFHFIGENGLMAEIPNSIEINYDSFKDGKYVLDFLKNRENYGR
jgi:hypothetical protein